MKKVYRLLLLLSFAAIFISSVPSTTEKIKWLTLKELQLAYKKQARPVLIDVYTSWCGWCKVMDKETYSNEKVAAYINANYYAVKFDAESTEPAQLGKNTYTYNPANKVNDLAMYLLKGQLGYPTTVMLSAIDARPAPIPGFMKPAQLEAPLKYFGNGIYKKQDYPAYMKEFTASW